MKFLVHRPVSWTYSFYGTRCVELADWVEDREVLERHLWDAVSTLPPKNSDFLKLAAVCWILRPLLPRLISICCPLSYCLTHSGWLQWTPRETGSSKTENSASYSSAGSSLGILCPNQWTPPRPNCVHVPVKRQCGLSGWVLWEACHC